MQFLCNEGSDEEEEEEEEVRDLKKQLLEIKNVVQERVRVPLRVNMRVEAWLYDAATVCRL